MRLKLPESSTIAKSKLSAAPNAAGFFIHSAPCKNAHRVGTSSSKTPPDLKVRQLLAILRVLQVTPQAFFGGLYSDEDGTTEMSPLSREELRDFVSQALREELVGLGTGSGEEEGRATEIEQQARKAAGE
jgi:hypothetical protein